VKVAEVLAQAQGSAREGGFESWARNPQRNRSGTTFALVSLILKAWNFRAVAITEIGMLTFINAVERAEPFSLTSYRLGAAVRPMWPSTLLTADGVDPRALPFKQRKAVLHRPTTRRINSLWITGSVQR
jgi:hypothetical protein